MELEGESFYALVQVRTHTHTHTSADLIARASLSKGVSELTSLQLPEQNSTQRFLQRI